MLCKPGMLDAFSIGDVRSVLCGWGLYCAGAFFGAGCVFICGGARSERRSGELRMEN